MYTYRIVEYCDGICKTLFHGINKSRVIPFGKWIRANEKMVRDGTGKKWYLSGFHSLRTVRELQKYMRSFRNRLDKLKIAKIEVRVIRLKPTNNRVILSRYMRLIRVL